MADQKILEDQMLFASAVTTERDAEEAVQALVPQIRAKLEQRTPDFVLVFLSSHYRLAVTDIADRLLKSLNPQVLLGCTGEGIIGHNQEIERESAISVVAAYLPKVELVPFTLQAMDWQEMLDDPDEFYQAVAAPNDTKLFVVLADPFTTPMDLALDAFNNFYPNIPIIGGMASGSQRAGGNALVLNDRTLKNGAVGVGLAGAFDIDVVVSQGCRPIGRPFTVTGASKNVIMSLEGESPLTHLQHVIYNLSTEDRDLLHNGLFVGRAVETGQDSLGRGDFLIRGVMGIDQDSGAIVIGDYVDEGETVQFHLRDATTAEEDLEMMLSPQLFYEPPSGGLLFSCNGRGTRLYDHPNGDISTIQKVIGDIDLAGFFCAGEIGPIGGRNFLHGHTASMVLFRPQAAEA